jgi:hypothetical protein
MTEEMTEQEKAEITNYKAIIDRMSYKSMLKRNRFAPAGDLMFQGEVGDYFLKVMHEKEAVLEPGEKTVISKEIGWKE